MNADEDYSNSNGNHPQRLIDNMIIGQNVRIGTELYTKVTFNTSSLLCIPDKEVIEAKNEPR